MYFIGPSVYQLSEDECSYPNSVHRNYEWVGRQDFPCGNSENRKKEVFVGVETL